MEKIISFQNIEVAPYIVEQLLDVRIDHFILRHCFQRKKRTVM